MVGSTHRRNWRSRSSTTNRAPARRSISMSRADHHRPPVRNDDVALGRGAHHCAVCHRKRWIGPRGSASLDQVAIAIPGVGNALGVGSDDRQDRACRDQDANRSYHVQQPWAVRVRSTHRARFDVGFPIKAAITPQATDIQMAANVPANIVVSAAAPYQGRAAPIT
jgi:hypothetical protein